MEEYYGLPNELILEICEKMNNETLLNFATLNLRNYQVCEIEINKRGIMKPNIPIPKYSPFSEISTELVANICENLDTNELVELSKSNKALYNACKRNLEKHRKTEKFQFRINLLDQRIVFNKDLNGNLKTPIIRPIDKHFPTGFKFYAGKFYRLNENMAISSLKFKTKASEFVIDNQYTSPDTLITLNPDYTVEISIVDGYIFYTNNKEVPELDLPYYNGMPLFSNKSKDVPFLTSSELMEYIRAKNPDIPSIEPEESTSIEPPLFTYYYDDEKKMYSFLELVITLPNDITYNYSRSGDTFLLTTNASGKLVQRNLTKEEIIAETGFVMELYPRQQRLFIPKADSLITARYLYEIALFIDLYPVSHFLDILQVESPIKN